MRAMLVDNLASNLNFLALVLLEALSIKWLLWAVQAF